MTPAELGMQGAKQKQIAKDEKKDKCLFCSKSRYNKESIKFPDADWTSDFILLPFDIEEPQKRFTVCPDCRKKHSINDIYAKLIENLLEGKE